MSWLNGFEHIIREQEPLARYTWLRLGGAARYFAQPTTTEELATLVRRATENGITSKLIGSGSNLLIPDAGIPGLVIHLTPESFGKLERQGNRLICGGGVQLAHLVSVAAREGLAGFEELLGIPGTVGGALHGNAGSVHSDIGTWTNSALVMTRSGEILQRSRKELRFSYRASNIDELIILQAEFELEPGNPLEITKRMQKHWIVKKAAVPPSSYSQGCLFKDAGGVTAASLIEQAGMKGFRIGDVQLSEQHTNFVLVGQAGTTAQVRDLIDTVRQNVMQRVGVKPETSLEIW